MWGTRRGVILGGRLGGAPGRRGDGTGGTGHPEVALPNRACPT